LTSYQIEIDSKKSPPSALIYFGDSDGVRQALEADGLSLWAKFKTTRNEPSTKSVARILIDQHVKCLPASESLQQAADKCMALFEKEEQMEVVVVLHMNVCPAYYLNFNPIRRINVPSKMVLMMTDSSQ
jgi:hypothetical protein